MWRSASFLVRYSLEITGTSIIAFNLLSETRQELLKGTYFAVANSYRSAKLIYQLGQSFKNDVLPVSDRNSAEFKQKLAQFNENAAASLYDLCLINKGVYAKIALNLSQLKRVFPDEYITAFSKLDQNLSSEPVPYLRIKKYLE